MLQEKLPDAPQKLKLQLTVARAHGAGNGRSDHRCQSLHVGPGGGNRSVSHPSGSRAFFGGGNENPLVVEAAGMLNKLLIEVNVVGADGARSSFTRGLDIIPMTSSGVAG